MLAVICMSDDNIALIELVYPVFNLCEMCILGVKCVCDSTHFGISQVESSCINKTDYSSNCFSL